MAKHLELGLQWGAVCTNEIVNDGGVQCSSGNPSAGAWYESGCEGEKVKDEAK